MNNGVLYVSYDGMLEPLGQSQVLAYLKGLASNRSIHLISFEKAEDWAHVAERENIALYIERCGITWHPLRYHKRPSGPSTAWDILRGTLLGWWLVIRHDLSLVHARSYVPSVMALALKRITGIRYLFDMRGFWADEKVDGKIWLRDSAMYRTAKWFERQFLINADHVISLTHVAVSEMENFSYLRGRMPSFSIIPTCADLSIFTPPVHAKGSANFVLGYVGSAGTWYMFDEVLACFLLLLRLRPDASLLIVNRNEHAYINQRLAAAGVPERSVEVISVSHADVPRQIGRMDAGIFFIQPAFSKQASAPTKLGEFLGCGVPCLGNTRVGDMADLLTNERVGVAVHGFDESTLVEGLRALLQIWADPTTRNRCVRTAERNFSLDEGVRRYEVIYRQLGAGP